jgi:hypothetical protein
MTHSKNNGAPILHQPGLHRSGLHPPGSASGFIAFAAVSGAISVIAGAFAAHGLNAETQGAEIGWLHTGSQYDARWRRSGCSWWAACCFPPRFMDLYFTGRVCWARLRRSVERLSFLDG